MLHPQILLPIALCATGCLAASWRCRGKSTKIFILHDSTLGEESLPKVQDFRDMLENSNFDGEVGLAQFNDRPGKVISADDQCFQLLQPMGSLARLAFNDMTFENPKQISGRTDSFTSIARLLDSEVFGVPQRYESHVIYLMTESLPLVINTKEAKSENLLNFPLNIDNVDCKESGYLQSSVVVDMIQKAHARLFVASNNNKWMDYLEPDLRFASKLTTPEISIRVFQSFATMQCPSSAFRFWHGLLIIIGIACLLAILVVFWEIYVVAFEPRNSLSEPEIMNLPGSPTESLTVMIQQPTDEKSIPADKLKSEENSSGA